MSRTAAAWMVANKSMQECGHPVYWHAHHHVPRLVRPSFLHTVDENSFLYANPSPPAYTGISIDFQLRVSLVGSPTTYNEKFLSFTFALPPPTFQLKI